MTDKEKLSKVRAEVERLAQLHLEMLEGYRANGNTSAAATENVLYGHDLSILSFIDSMQEEPDLNWKDMSLQEKKDLVAKLSEDIRKEESTTSVWHDTRSEEPIVGRNIVMWYYDHMYSGEYLGERFFGREKWTLMSDSKWAYVEDLLKL